MLGLWGESQSTLGGCHTLYLLAYGVDSAYQCASMTPRAKIYSLIKMCE